MRLRMPCDAGVSEDGFVNWSDDACKGSGALLAAVRRRLGEDNVVVCRWDTGELFDRINFVI